MEDDGRYADQALPNVPRYDFAEEMAEGRAFKVSVARRLTLLRQDMAAFDADGVHQLSLQHRNAGSDLGPAQGCGVPLPSDRSSDRRT